MDEDAAINYAVGLQTAGERRAATAVARAELLAAVRALSGCQRCGFVEQVLAAFDPDLASGMMPPPTPSNASASCGERNCVMAPSQLLALLSGSGGSTDLVGLLQFAWKDVGVGMGAGGISNSTGNSIGVGVGGFGAAAGDRGDSGSGSGGVLTLSDTLLARPRLLRRFLTDSKVAMQALAADVGDCRRHVGYPGPSELASTLARLDTQRRHTLERLAAWGVLKSPPAPQPAAAASTAAAAAAATATADVVDAGVAPTAAAACGGPGAGAAASAVTTAVMSGEGCSPERCRGQRAAPRPTRGAWSPLQSSPRPSPQQPPLVQQQQLLQRHHLQQHQQQEASPQQAGLGGGEGTGGGLGARASAAIAASAAAIGEEDDGFEDDPQLALAIRLSLQEAGMATNSSPVERQQAAACLVPSPGPSPGRHGQYQHQQGSTSQGSGAPRRPQRTPPRPTAGLERSGGGGGVSPAPAFDYGISGGGRGSEEQWASPPPGGLATCPGPLPGRSPGSSGAGGAVGSRPTGMGPEGGPPVSPSREALAACGLAVKEEQPYAGLQPPAQPPRSPSRPTSAPAPQVHTRHGAPCNAPSGAGPGTEASPGPDTTGGGHGDAGVPAPLPVSEAVSVAAGMADASVLVDSATVAALPEGLRQRVEQLVAQLVQVQQRRGRLEHACQHGVLAGGRKLLLLLLQLMWGTLRRAASAATAAANHVGSAAAAAVQEENEDLDGAASARGEGASTGAASAAFAFAGASSAAFALAACSGTPSALAAVGGAVLSPAASAAPCGATPAPLRVQPVSPGPPQRPQPQPQPKPRQPLASQEQELQQEPDQQQHHHHHHHNRWQRQPQPQPQASPQAQAQLQVPRRPRYEGLLADLAAGLADDDMYLDILAGDLGFGLDLALELEPWELNGGEGPQLRSGTQDEGAREGSVGGAEDKRSGGETGTGGGGGGEVGVSDRDVDGDDDDSNDVWLREVRPPAGPSAVATHCSTAAAAVERSSPLLSPGGAESPGPAVRSGGAAAERQQQRLRRRLLPGQPSGEQPLRPTAGDGAKDADGGGSSGCSGGWDAAHPSSVARWSIASAAPQHWGLPTAQALAPGPPAAAPNARRKGSALFAPGIGGLGLGAGSASAAAAAASGGVRASVSYFGPAEGARWAALEREAGVGGGAGGGCSADCLRVRAEQAEQLRILQGQLERCQASQTELQAEMGRLLDMMGESRRRQEQAVSSVRRELAQWQGELGALQGLGAEELAELAGRMEAALSRVRAAHLQAAADRDLMCPVCWERRKGLVFACGHQTCCNCGEKLSCCPICREPISLRIRVYS